MILAYAYCPLSIIPLKKDPSHRSEQVSQLLFGERAEVLEVNEKGWASIRNCWDGYEGWCLFSQLSVMEKRTFRKPNHFITQNHFDKIIFDTHEMWIPAGGELIGIKGKQIVANGVTGKFKGKKTDLRTQPCTTDILRETSLGFLGAPYQWGGRAITGIDCSGLTQMIFKICNQKLQRDAAQQAQEGEPVDFLQHAQCGDLAFFDNEEGKINHVGMLLEGNNIIHATETSGKVVVDRIDQGGIISIALKKRTHKLRMVKRFVN